MKTVKERDLPDLIELSHQLHARANMGANKEVHDAYVEARNELELRFTTLSKEIENTWLSPIESERKWQEENLKKLWPDYPDGSFRWQYFNGLITLANSVNNLTKERDEAREVLQWIDNNTICERTSNKAYDFLSKYPIKPGKKQKQPGRG